MEALQILSRSEMRNIKGGGCEWDGCGGSSVVFNCWRAECNARYYGTNNAAKCAKQVGESQKFAIAMCGLNYS